MGGFQGALQGLHAGNEIQRKDLLSKQAQQKLTRQMDADQMLRDVLAQQQQAGDMHPVSIANALISTGHPDLVDKGFGIQKDFRSKVKTTQPVLKDGQEFTQPIFDDGSFGEVSSLPRPVRPMQVNQGNQVSFIDPNSLQSRGAVGVGMSPGESARLAQSAQQFGASHGLAQQNSAMQAQKLMMEMDPAFQAQKAASVAAGKQQALNSVEAKKALPGVIDKANESINLIDNLIGNKDKNIPEHPGLRISVGGSSPIGSATAFVHRGSDAADFARRMEQIGGQQFLQAFESLKGGGAITEVEGQKATQAISRMNTASSEPEFIKAAEEFREVINKGLIRAKSAAGEKANSDGWGDLR